MSKDHLLSTVEDIYADDEHSIYGTVSRSVYAREHPYDVACRVLGALLGGDTKLSRLEPYQRMDLNTEKALIEAISIYVRTYRSAIHGEDDREVALEIEEKDRQVALELNEALENGQGPRFYEHNFCDYTVVRYGQRGMCGRPGGQLAAGLRFCWQHWDIVLEGLARALNDADIWQGNARAMDQVVEGVVKNAGLSSIREDRRDAVDREICRRVRDRELSDELTELIDDLVQERLIAKWRKKS